MDFIHYQANQLFYQILDADSYRKPLDSRRVGNAAGYKIGNGTLYVPGRLYFSVFCDTLNTGSIQYTVNYRNIQPITTGRVTSGLITTESVTSGQVTSGSVTTAEVTTGVAFTTGSSVTSGEATTQQLTSGDITTGMQI